MSSSHPGATDAASGEKVPATGLQTDIAIALAGLAVRATAHDADVERARKHRETLGYTNTNTVKPEALTLVTTVFVCECGAVWPSPAPCVMIRYADRGRHDNSVHYARSTLLQFPALPREHKRIEKSVPYCERCFDADSELASEARTVFSLGDEISGPSLGREERKSEPGVPGEVATMAQDTARTSPAQHPSCEEGVCDKRPGVCTRVAGCLQGSGHAPAMEG